MERIDHEQVRFTDCIGEFGHVELDFRGSERKKQSSQRFMKILLAKISADAADDGPSKDRK